MLWLGIRDHEERPHSDYCYSSLLLPGSGSGQTGYSWWGFSLNVQLLKSGSISHILIGHEPLAALSSDYFPLPDLFDNLFDIEQDQQQGGPDGGDLLFPTLNKEQQRFAVNPAYPGYTATVFGNPTDPSDEEEANDEVVEDPFFSTDLSAFPKKASLKALVDGDPRVLANAIEDKIYDNDIYFTSNVPSSFQPMEKTFNKEL